MNSNAKTLHVNMGIFIVLRQADRSQSLGKLELLPPTSFSISGSKREIGGIPLQENTHLLLF